MKQLWPEAVSDILTFRGAKRQNRLRSILAIRAQAPRRTVEIETPGLFALATRRGWLLGCPCDSTRLVEALFGMVVLVAILLGKSGLAAHPCCLRLLRRIWSPSWRGRVMHVSSRMDKIQPQKHLPTPKHLPSLDPEALIPDRGRKWDSGTPCNTFF